jgi:Fe(II)/alpha-ketoglutarate-dependent arginine beta-hydroxylase
MVDRYTLSDDEIRAIKTLVAELTSRYVNPDDNELLRKVGVYAHELPRPLRLFLNDFKYLEPEAGTCIVSGYPLENEKLGRTPSHWNCRDGVSPAIEEEMFLLLLGSLLGDAIGWATQQDGYILHDVIPIKEYENSQLGTGSLQKLWWHNEDAFHPYRGDYLGLMCLRNPDNVSTTFASIGQVKLDEGQVSKLFEPQFTIRPDESHSIKNNSNADSGDALISSAYNRINDMNEQPAVQPVLFGDPRTPYVRVDPYFMESPKDDAALAALNGLINAIDEKITDIVLHPGDCLFIDNYRTVHGRRPFRARYDGADRWLKRVNITRDLRKSRSSRLSCESRIIY